jgi:16S rRNA (guanine966-N2)-methyltransferase
MTRPTSDRVREAMFSMLTSMDAIEGARVLDLYAGSGALGIEALSRGAESAVFVDDDPAAVAAVRANLEVLGLAAARASVVRADALQYAASTSQVDLVLVDPPYSFDAWAPLLRALGGRAGLVVAESGRDWEPGPEWETVKVKHYGGTVVTVVQPMSPLRSPLHQEGEA